MPPASRIAPLEVHVRHLDALLARACPRLGDDARLAFAVQIALANVRGDVAPADLHHVAGGRSRN